MKLISSCVWRKIENYAFWIDTNKFCMDTCQLFFKFFKMNLYVSIHMILYRYIALQFGQNVTHVSIHGYMLRYMLWNNWLVSIQTLICIDTKRVKQFYMTIFIHSCIKSSQTSSSPTWTLSKPLFPILYLSQNLTKTSQI